MAEPVSAQVEALIVELHELGAIKFGSFTLKSGVESPIYVDLRVLVSHPQALDRVADALVEATASASYDLMCGVPYTALPFATIMSAKTNKPMLMRRKEVKQYGTKKAIEGVYTAGQTCLIVEDLVTSGLSVFETVAPLEDESLVVNDVVVLLDRGQGGKQNVIMRGKQLHSVMSLQQVMKVLLAKSLVTEAVNASVLKFLVDNKVTIAKDEATGEYSAVKTGTPAAAAPKAYTFEERGAVSTNAAGKALFEVMVAKQSNLCVAADVTTTADLLALAKAVGPYVCCLKTHCDIVGDWTAATASSLAAVAKEHGFLIFEDRKFADIGNTVVQQCRGGHHKIATWADFVNAHSLPGSGIVAGLKEALSCNPKAGLLLLAEMSSAGNLIDDGYTAKTLQMAVDHPDLVFGFIAQHKLRDVAGAPDPLVYMTPGVKLQQGGDALGQQYNTPSLVVGTKGTDVIIVGRGIYGADDKVAAAKAYQKAGWDAYLTRVA